MNHRQAPRWGVAFGAASCLVLALTGCTGQAGEREADAGPAVIAPGAPGERAETVAPAEAERVSREQSRPNAADVAFLTMMVEHHQQALEMSDLAEQRAGSDAVRRMAERIRLAQDPEITLMRSWLAEHDGAQGADGADGGHEEHEGHEGHASDPGPEHGRGGHAHDHEDQHDHEAMPGMASPAQMAELRDAEGAAFDALFLTLMIAHHDGGVSMATDVLTEGNAVRVEELATEMAAQQSAEIERMRALQD
ncbi:DUF305 domain-containing protein [Streptomyces sp. TRM70308]|uniref:DUF305 domain-containing protein n=1 Tax=Streptomyces sp. TRM70308 TaxID=3131932 RepID=UPI003CFBEE91